MRWTAVSRLGRALPPLVNSWEFDVNLLLRGDAEALCHAEEGCAGPAAGDTWGATYG